MSDKTFIISATETLTRTSVYHIDAESEQDALSRLAENYSDLEPVSTEYPNPERYDVFDIQEQR